MDSVNLSKSDLKRLFALVSAVPLLSFILGISVANMISVTPGYSNPTSPNGDIDGLTVNSTSPPERVNFEDAHSALSTGLLADTATTPMTKRYIVQAGLFSSEENAKRLSLALERKNLTTQIVSETGNDAPLFRVIVGSFALEDNAKALSESIQKSYAIKLYVADTETLKLDNLVAAL